ADDLSVLLGDQLQQHIPVLLQLLDDLGLIRLPEGAGVELKHGFRVGRRLFADDAIRHASLRPCSMRTPRWNSSAVIWPFPALCKRVSRTAPLPHATSRLSSSTSPGAPEPLSCRACRTLMRCPSSSNHAPGNGDSPLICALTSAAGFVQSIFA